MVTVIDYGMGNVWSVLSALRYLGARTELTDDPDQIARSGRLILPGVGSFRAAMQVLRDRGIDQAIHHAVEAGSNLLGICLGMQLLGSQGSEDGLTTGLGLYSRPVGRFTEEEVGQGRKIPHVGFNTVTFVDQARLFARLPESADFYFVHSYRMLPDSLSARIGVCEYGIPFLAAFEQDNIAGVQFHPEKSQSNGLILLSNFLRM